ncbi:MAG: PDZ domain-containing protein [Lewinellaceae bacterium]|nr:PDZ domain-containing protein [Lewinellaceae bacterium]
MKTVHHLLTGILLFLACCTTSAFAQSSVPSEGETKVIITKRTIDADGTEITETIVKKGKAAENFDVNRYLRENRAENVELDVRVQGSEEGDSVIRINSSIDIDLDDLLERNLSGLAELNVKPKRGFLGVTPKEDAKHTSDGVVVGIVENSAAEKAGLRDGDILTRLNDSGVRVWEDISDFMADTKPEQQVRVTYLRDGKKNTADLVLGTQKTAAWDFKFEPQDLKVAVDTREKAACLGVYSDASGTGDKQGACISDFTRESAAREADMIAGDVITAVNGVRVQGHSALWDEIARYQPGDKIVVDFLRDDQSRQVEASLKACQDNSNKVILNKTDKDGADAQREFFLGNWVEKDEQSLRERQVITIRRSTEGDAPQVVPVPETTPDRALQLEGFRAYPNPTVGQLTVEFRTEPLPTVVSLLDMSGRQLFREELNAFGGDYLQRFDLSEFAKGTVIIHVLQGDKVFTEKIILK